MYLLMLPWVMFGRQVFALRPILRHLGYGLSAKEAFVLAFGGLRGAVGLALALIVKLDNRIKNRLSGRVLFFAGGIAALTLLVNGSLTGFVVQKLGLTRRDAAKKQSFRMVMDYMLKRMKDSVHETKDNTNYKGADWNRVEKIVIDSQRRWHQLAGDLDCKFLVSTPSAHAFATFVLFPVRLPAQLSSATAALN